MKLVKFGYSDSPRPTPPIISFVGKSNSGKTTFLEKLIPELKRRGFRVGVVKHDAHSFEIDHPGKDSYRLKHASADAVVISSSSKIALVKDAGEDTSLQTLRREFMMDMDVILTEGYKRDNATRIEISRRDNSTEIICAGGECLALVADWNPNIGVPVHSLDDVRGIADLVQKQIAENSAIAMSS